MTTRGRGAVRKCPVTHRGQPCGARVAAGRITCRLHWARVPPGLRTAAMRLWGRWQETLLDDDWDQFITARAAALASVDT